MENGSSNNNFKVIQSFCSQLLVDAADLCQSNIEAETIMEDMIMALLGDSGGEKEDAVMEGNSPTVVSGGPRTPAAPPDGSASTATTKISPRDVWIAIENYFELDKEERKTTFTKCQEYCRQLDQKGKLPAEFATFFIDSGSVQQESEESCSLQHDNECSDYSDKESNNEEEEDDSEDESAYFMNDESWCELCERTNIKLTKHHLIPKSTWPRMRTRLLHAMEAMERGDIDKANMILGSNLGHVLTTALSYSSTTTTTTTRLSRSHNSKQPQQQEKDGGGKTLPTLDQHNNSRRAHIRQALSYTCNVCRQCHSMVHSTHDNMTLALEYNTTEKLLEDPAISKYCHWASKQRAGKYRL